MKHLLYWLHEQEKKLFFWFNHSLHSSFADRFFGTLTYMGGATFTILTTLLVGLLAKGAWSMAGWQSLAALAISHIPVAIIKKTFKRKRPYLVLSTVNLHKNPLKDHSFPSGHTTAICSIIFPFIYVAGWLALILIPIALLVAMSRMYLGQHYPSDCVAGGLIGTVMSLWMIAVFS
ncbi:putative undecaprenyl-diphosphatase YbjG [compost metagenome]